MTKSKQTSARRGWGAYLAVLLLQIAVFTGTAIAWWWLQFQGGARCGDFCDLGTVQLANAIFIAFSVAAVAITVSTAVISRFTSRDLLWIPFASCALIVVGYFPAAAIYNAATGG